MTVFGNFFSTPVSGLKCSYGKISIPVTKISVVKSEISITSVTTQSLKAVTFGSLVEILSVSIQMKATERYFPAVLFIMQYNVVLTCG